MKKIVFTLFALALSMGSFAQLIADKTSNKVTANIDLFTDFQLKTNENWDPRGFNQGFSAAITYNFPFNESNKHTISIGLGISTHNYFSYSQILNPYNTDTLQFEQWRGKENFKRYKVNPIYGEIPVELRFRIKDAVKIGVGIKFGVMWATRTRFVGPDIENEITKIDVKYLYIKNIERFAYAATFRIGYKFISAYCAYQFSRVFEDGHDAPAIFPLSVGITLAPF